MQAFIGNSQKTNNRRTILSRQKFFLANCRVGHPPVTTGPSESRGQRTTPIQKSDNLQYNTLDCWFAGTNDSSSKRLMFQALFFLCFLIDRTLKTLYFHFCKFIKKK